MKKGTKISKTKRANKAFETWSLTRYPIPKEKGEGLFYADADEIFVKCKTFQKKWYVSNRGNVISFANPDKPILLNSDTNKRGRERYKRSDKKTIQIAQLVAESFDVYRFGKTNKWQVHHIRKYDVSMGRAYNNNPDYLQYVSQQAHELLTYLQNNPRNKRTPEQEKYILELLNKIVKSENPNNATIVIDGDNETSIHSEKQETVIKVLEKTAEWPIINTVGMLALVEMRFDYCLNIIENAGFYDKLTLFTLLVNKQRRYYRIKDKKPQLTNWYDCQPTDIIKHFICDNNGVITYSDN